MPRRPRVLIEGGLYHVFNRVSRGLQPFKNERDVKRFLEIAGDTKKRDSFTLYAWCLLPGAYHLALRTEMVSLSRSMRTIQHRFAQLFNRNNGDVGPFWQGRYKAMLMPDQQDFRQLLAYIHVHPVASGLAESPAAYPFSGHREVLGKRKAVLVDVEAVMAAFAETPRVARRRYNELLTSTQTLDWAGSRPGWLPWWRVGRPAATAAQGMVDPAPTTGPRVRIEDVGLLVAAGAETLKVSRELLESRLKSHPIVRARELLAVVAVEHFGVRVKDLASSLNKAPESVSRWISQVLRRRIEDQDLRRQIEELAQSLGRRL